MCTHRLPVRRQFHPCYPRGWIRIMFMNIIRRLAMYSGLTYIMKFILSTTRGIKHVRTLIQSIFLPLRTYLDKGCLMTKPSPRLAMISSIFILISFTVFPRNSTVNSRRPGTSFKQCRRFLLRKATDLCKTDCPLRYKRSKTLTSEVSRLFAYAQYLTYSRDEDCAPFLSCLFCKMSWELTINQMS